MPVICRLLQLSNDQAAALLAKPEGLGETVAAAQVYSGVYRYWDGIGYLLAQHVPGTVAGRWLSLGRPVSATNGEIPGARVIETSEVAQLAAALDLIPPDELYAHYDAPALDAAKIYPRTWEAWEEDFDPAGQVLEHYSFLQSFARRRADAGEAMLLYFVFDDDGSDP